MDDYKPSLKKNFIFSFIAQIICYLSPLIVSPFLTRVLGAENIGLYSFSYSYAHYFILFASFGFANYGTMIISESRGDFDRRNQLFWSLLITRLIFVLISSLIFTILLLSNAFVGATDKNMMLVFLFLIVSTAFDISFFFRGIEKLGIISFVTALVNVFYVVSVLLFVKSTNDLLIFTIFKTLSTSLIYFTLWLFCFKRITLPKISKKDMMKIFKGSLAFFLPTLVMGISTSLDQTLVGIFSNNVQVAFYQQSAKITTLLSAILYSVSSVILARTSLLNSEKAEDEEKKLLFAKSFLLGFFILAPVVAGLYAVGNMFIPLYYGDEFIDSVPTFFWLLPVSLISSLSSIVIAGYYYPLRKTKNVTLIVFISIMINVALSILLLVLTDFGAVAAAIGSVVAEAFILLVLILGAKKIISPKLFWKDLLKILISTGIMVICVLLLNSIVLIQNFNQEIYIIMIYMIFGALVYYLLLLLSREDILFLGMNMIFSKFKKAKKEEQ